MSYFQILISAHLGSLAVSAAVQHQLTAVVCMLHSDTLTVKKAKEEFGDILDPDQSVIVQVKTQLKGWSLQLVLYSHLRPRSRFGEMVKTEIRERSRVNVQSQLSGQRSRTAIIS